MVFTTYLNEDMTEELYPVFILLSQGKSVIGKAIKAVTHSQYSHVSISLDPNLNYFYSYNMGNNMHGFTIENKYIFIKRSNKINISVFFVNKQTHRDIARALQRYSRNIDKTKYSIQKLFGCLFKKNWDNKNPYNQVCSSFVYNILLDCGIKIAPDDIICVKPSDIEKTINNNKKYIYNIYDGPVIDLDEDMIKIKVEKIKNSKKAKLFDQDKIVLQESITPELVDRSEYDKFVLFDFFHIYTTDKTLRDDPVFLSKMKWVKDRIDEICDMAGWISMPYELTLCASFDDLNKFYNNQAPIWVTGFTYGENVYMKAPSIYPGDLYYNVVLHECIHSQIFQNEKRKGMTISREDEEGMAVFFSTPLDAWLRELNHGPNWYYYESAIRVQDDFMRGGLPYVIKKRFRKE